MENKPRKKWVVGFLSLIQPGLGHVYNGQLLKAIIIYILPFMLFLLLPLCLNTTYIRTLLIMFVVLIPTYYLWTIIDAVKTAGRLSFEYHPKKYNRLIVYIGIFLMMATVVNVTSEVLKNYVIQAYKFPSTSMEPTVLVGDHILVDRREQAKERRRGDLIVFEYPKDETKDFMKRVVAIGGDTVEIRDKQLIVNGNPVTEAYVEYMDKLVMPANQSPRDNFGPITVPGNFYFVLGDNRDRSLDSRFFGVVEQSKVKGTVKTIYWSWDNQKCSVRWARVGKGVL